MPRLALHAALAWAACSPATLCADVVYDLAMHNAGFYFQDFNGLPTSSDDGAGYFVRYPDEAVVPNGAQLPVLGALSFDAARISGSNGSILANDGRLTTAGLMSLGFGDAENGPIPSTDRALGALASSSRTMAFGFDLKNEVAQGEITSITVHFWQETWRAPASKNTFTAAWGTSQTGDVTGDDYLSTTEGMTVVSQLSLVQEVSGAAGPVDGNSAPFRVERTFTFQNLNLAFGDHFYLRWQDVNESGDNANASIGIDDLTLTFTHSASQAAAVPEISSFTLLMVASLICSLIVFGWHRVKATGSRAKFGA